MEDYTKFRLKRNGELVSLLNNGEDIFVVTCNKCFREFEPGDGDEGYAFGELARGQGKTVTGRVKIDFLCNREMTAKKLRIPAGAGRVFVISCGLGIQTVADIAGVPVFAACDSIPQNGHHGMALTAFRCDACGQCYLNISGGICPVVDCAKSLVNGQCGGSKNGKCEVDSGRDCAWDRIYRRLEKQGRLSEYLNRDTQIRNYGKASYGFVSARVKSIRERRFEGFYGGVYPKERKEISGGIALRPFPDVARVVIPLHQHAGVPARPVVAAGDFVRVGQKIGEAAGLISAMIHASISGRVTAVEPRRHPFTGADVLSVVIDNDGKNTVDDSVKPAGRLDELSAGDIAHIVREKGIVGMGGAAFPAAVKLRPAQPVDTVLLNGCECEPLLTSDQWVMLAFADDVVFGLRALIKAVNARRGIIVIEDNKRGAIELVQSKAAGFAGVEVAAVRTKYPQGAEKLLVKRVTGRQVPPGGLPSDCGCVVSNVSTAKAIAGAIRAGMPLVERVVTVSGERVARPGNFIVKIGTPVREILDFCGGVKGGGVTVKLGGPMMGVECGNLDVPVIKGCNGIIAVETEVSRESPCIRCGRCADVCPMELLPLYFPAYARKQDWAAMNGQRVRDCIECGCCQYICPSKISLVASIKAGKKAIAAAAGK